MKENRTIIVVVLIVLLLLGVVFVFVGGKKSSDNVEVVSVPNTIVVQDTVVVEQTNEGSEEKDAATIEPVDVEPTPREGLQATDPSTVNLASGGLLFVEAFDFY